MRSVPSLAQTDCLAKAGDIDFLASSEDYEKIEKEKEGLIYVPGTDTDGKKVYFRLRLQATGNCLAQGEYGYYLQCKFVSLDDIDHINNLETLTAPVFEKYDFTFKNILGENNVLFIKLPLLKDSKPAKFRASFCPAVDLENLENSPFEEGLEFDMLAEPVLWGNLKEKTMGVSLKPVIISVPGYYPEIEAPKKTDVKKRKVMRK